MIVIGLPVKLLFLLKYYFSVKKIACYIYTFSGRKAFILQLLYSYILKTFKTSFCACGRDGRS